MNKKSVPLVLKLPHKQYNHALMCAKKEGESIGLWLCKLIHRETKEQFPYIFTEQEFKSKYGH
jgi:hypothetical protein